MEEPKGNIFFGLQIRCFCCVEGYKALFMFLGFEGTLG